MSSGNHWGGSFEIENTRGEESERSSKGRELNATQQSWLLNRHEDKSKRNHKYVDLGCVICSRKAFKWTLGILLAGALVIALPTIIAKSLPKHKAQPSPVDSYTLALHKALRFFNAQKLTDKRIHVKEISSTSYLYINMEKEFGIPWRKNSGLKDGFDLPELTGGLLGGYYNDGSNTKIT